MRGDFIYSMLFNQPWAITPRYLETLIARFSELSPVDLDAVATKLGRPLENTGGRAEIRGSTAIIDLNGPIFRYASLFANVSGLTSVEMVARDIQTANENGQVENILLRVDSPGGEVTGIADLAEQIRKSPKPVTAFIGGLGASAAYWLASAAHKVYGSVDSFSGSIGVIATIRDNRGAQEKQGVKTYQIVSSQSPRKLADPATEEGHASLLEMVDSLGALFVERVAGYRNVSAATVMTDFGRGFVLPSRLAHKAGMIDGVITEEALLASLNNKQPVAVAAAQEESMENPTQPAPAPATTSPAPTIDGAAQERQRIQAIFNLPEAQGREQLARTLAFEGLSPEASQRILASVPVAAPPAPVTPLDRPLDRAMAGVKNPVVGEDTDDGATIHTEAAAILAFLPAHQKVNRAS